MGTPSADEHAALAAFLADRDLTGPEITTRLIGDGHSNLTYLVDDGRARVVVRRPPPPPSPPGAHDVLREARLMAGLATTDVPVPAVLAVAGAGEPFDVPLVVMSHVAGPVVTTTTPAPLDTPALRRQVGESLVDALVALHAVDPDAVGLGDLGRPEGFNLRQLRRLRPLVADADGALPAPFAEEAERLERHAPPESGATVVHGDFRLGNLVLAPDPPGRVAAVLDWELATLGDPLHDLAYLLECWPSAGERRTPTQDMGTAVLETGWPTRDELAARYAAASGRDLAGLGWYRAMANWKLAALYEYSRRRGTDPYYAEPGLVDRFLAAARGHQML